MITRASQYLLPTLKDDPADAEAISHRLLVRAGYVRQVGSGLYAFLPLGWKVMQRIAAILREEMDTLGMEVSMPVLNPAELWRETGRLGVNNLFRLEDSSGKQYVLAMTHEECFTFIAAREIRSYRELPQVWYQIQTKERDEPRPKSGILRTREFMMKDSYSFDRDFDGLDASYDRHIEVYKRIFGRCGLETWMVESDTGMMGGKSAHEFMVPSPSGEDRLVLCSNCDYAANLEVARSTARPPVFPGELAAPEDVATPDATTIEALAQLLDVDPAATAKAMPVVADGEVVLALVRGDDRLHQLKTQKALRSDFRPATAEEIRTTFGAEPGSIGPVGVTVRVLADESLRDGQFVAGANVTGHHLRGVQAGRDFEPEFHDLREVSGGETCPNCGVGTLTVEQAIEVGNIFKLGTRFSDALNATYLDESGTEQTIVMGSYGIGLARIMAATVEQSHDEKGIVWPAALAPFDVHMVVIGEPESPQRAVAETIAVALDARGLRVLVDDRDMGPGARFADAELIGIPTRVTVGKRTASEGTADLQVRRGREQSSLPVADVADAVIRALAEN
jgi:prolyl-tRNA synthetase